MRQSQAVNKRRVTTTEQMENSVKVYVDMKHIRHHLTQQIVMLENNTASLPLQLKVERRSHPECETGMLENQQLSTSSLV